MIEYILKVESPYSMSNDSILQIKGLIAQNSRETKWSTDVFFLYPSNKSPDKQKY